MRAKSVSADCRPLVLCFVLALCVATVPPGVAASATDAPTRGSVTADSVATASVSPPDDVTITVEQGEDCYEIDPLGDGTRTVEAFYDYNISEDYSSLGTTDLQENQVSNLVVYHGSEGYSLVMIHDAHATDELGLKPYGSTITFDITGLPADGEWAVEDDSYPGRDDNFDHEETRSVIDWKWSGNRTDGGAFRGLAASDRVSITIDPRFNEAAAAWDEWQHSGTEEDRITEWRLFTGPDEHTTLDRDANVTVNRGGCDQPPSAALSAEPATAAVDESVTLNATDATDDEGIRRYGWDFDGDGTVDLNTTAPTADYTYEETGDYEAAVTVWDYANNTATASTTVTITESGSDGDSGDDDSGDDGDGTDSDDGSETDGPDDVPVPALTGPATAAVGETVTLDANASTDGDGIQSYGWNFDDDTTIDRTTTAPTIETSFDAAGTYTLRVTVGDENGNEATAEHVIEVGSTGADSPTGEIDAPEEVTVGDPITVEAVSLSDDLTHVCWFFDGASGPEGTTAQHTFDQPGTHEITLSLRDERGGETEITTEVSITADDDKADGGDGDSGSDGSNGADDGDGDSGSDGSNGADDGDSDDGSDGSNGADDGDSDDGSDGSNGADDGDSDDGTNGGGADDGSDGSGDNSGDTGVNVGIDIDSQGPQTGPIDVSELESDDSADSRNGSANDSSVSVAAVRTGRATVDAGSSVEITVRFDETGNGTDQMPLTLRRHRENGTDSVVDELSVSVPETETETVSVATTVERPGEYRAGVGNRTAAFSVLAPGADGSDDGPATDRSTASRFGASAPADEPADATEATTADTTTRANGPGFGILAAALGLVLAGLLAARRRLD